MKKYLSLFTAVTMLAAMAPAVAEDPVEVQEVPAAVIQEIAAPAPAPAPAQSVEAPAAEKPAAAPAEEQTAPAEEGIPAAEETSAAEEPAESASDAAGESAAPDTSNAVIFVVSDPVKVNLPEQEEDTEITVIDAGEYPSDYITIGANGETVQAAAPASVSRLRVKGDTFLGGRTTLKAEISGDASQVEIRWETSENPEALQPVWTEVTEARNQSEYTFTLTAAKAAVAWRVTLSNGSVSSYIYILVTEKPVEETVIEEVTAPAPAANPVEEAPAAKPAQEAPAQKSGKTEQKKTETAPAAPAAEEKQETVIETPAEEAAEPTVIQTIVTVDTTAAAEEETAAAEETTVEIAKEKTQEEPAEETAAEEPAAEEADPEEETETEEGAVVIRTTVSDEVLESWDANVTDAEEETESETADVSDAETEEADADLNDETELDAEAEDAEAGENSETSADEDADAETDEGADAEADKDADAAADEDADSESDEDAEAEDGEDTDIEDEEDDAEEEADAETEIVDYSIQASFTCDYEAPYYYEDEITLTAETDLADAEITWQINQDGEWVDLGSGKNFSLILDERTGRNAIRAIARTEDAEVASAEIPAFNATEFTPDTIEVTMTNAEAAAYGDVIHFHAEYFTLSTGAHVVWESSKDGVTWTNMNHEGQDLDLIVSEATDGLLVRAKLLTDDTITE